MCLNPLKIKNKSKYIDYKNGHHLFYNIPCGKCAECQQDKIDSYMVRSWAQANETFLKGGINYVDCLTYDNAHIHEHSDIEGFYVFCKKDVQCFIKRLKKRLLDNGYFTTYEVPYITNNGVHTFKIKKRVPLKYFCASEFGGQFHRPHMHIIFNFDLSIDPNLFDKFIRDTWYYGINDKYHKDGSLKMPEEKVIHSMAAMVYVSKYVIKDDDFVIYLFSQICNRFLDRYYNDIDFQENVKDKLGLYVIDFIESRKNFSDDIDDYSLEDVEYIHSIVKTCYNLLYEVDDNCCEDKRSTSFDDISPFHLQSNGYGVCLAQKSYIDNNGDLHDTEMYIRMKEDNMISFKDENNQERHVKIPQYIKRKLWYECYKDFDGTLHWVLNQDGIQHREDMLAKSAQDLADRYQKIVNNLSNYIEDNRDYITIYNRIYDLLGSRSFFDFALYKLVYQGVMLDDKRSVPDLYTLYLNKPDMLQDSKDFISVTDGWKDSAIKLFGRLGYVMQYDQFIDMLYRKYCVCQDSFDEFSNYDDLSRLFDELQATRNRVISADKFEKYKDKIRAKRTDPRYAQHELNNINHRCIIKSNL